MIFFQIILPIVFCISITQTILDDDILYDIKWQPELTSTIDLANNYIFTSKRKETYSCVLPTPQAADTTLPDTILYTELQSFFENLHAQSKSTCTYRLDPYWTYELCHGIHIRQFHETKVAGQKTHVQEYLLGTYHSDNQNILINEYNQQLLSIHYKTINNQQVPMLAVRYTHGTDCEINSNTPRETLVLYVCHEKGNNGILTFQEVSSCYYEITIASSQLCKIPAFNPVEKNRHTINCYPHENALQQPRNLKKLEREQELLEKRGGSAQFTMTSADGTTFIISYQYANEGDVKDLINNVNTDLTNQIPSENTQQPQQVVDNMSHEFLEKFLSGQECLISGSGWWRYEICYGKHVVQFHENGQERTSVVLGTWNHEKHIQWINTNPEKKSGQNDKERPYVSLYYADGDPCELTNIPRVVEVKLKCVRKGDESQAVETSLFCNLIDYTDENGIPDQEKLFKRTGEQ